MPPTIGELVKGTTARFKFYRDGELWYDIYGGLVTPRVLYSFPVPISDTGTGNFPAECKSITLMRWVRKYLEKEAQWAKERENG